MRRPNLPTGRHHARPCRAGPGCEAEPIPQADEVGQRSRVHILTVVNQAEPRPQPLQDAESFQDDDTDPPADRFTHPDAINGREPITESIFNRLRRSVREHSYQLGREPTGAFAPSQPARSRPSTGNIASRPSTYVGASTVLMIVSAARPSSKVQNRSLNVARNAVDSAER